jgi:hypothetical protein
MKILKEIVSKVPRDYIFITGTFDIDSQYFKKRIEEGIKTSTLNYKTNVVGKHTAWHFFNRDDKFMVLLLQLIDHLESLNTNLDTFHLGIVGTHRKIWRLYKKASSCTRLSFGCPLP